MRSSGHVLALCGGVGGAKLAFGLARVLPPEDLTIAVNTGDDFVHLGLHVSPDIDTVVYTLSGIADRRRGWGVAGESWQFMDALRRLGGETWFQLGDRDLAMHVERTRQLAAGETLSSVTAALADALGIRHAVVPMSDDPVRTVVQTTEGELPFQRYFVGEQCRPAVTAIRFTGAESAVPAPAFAAALERRDLAAVIVCPSNPYLSIDPMLAIPAVRQRLQALVAPVVAVSPIVGGQAVKGPTAKLMRELGEVPSASAVARHYGRLVTGLIVDQQDSAEEKAIRLAGVEPCVAATLMRSDEDRIGLAEETLAFAVRLAGSG